MKPRHYADADGLPICRVDLVESLQLATQRAHDRTNTEDEQELAAADLLRVRRLVRDAKNAPNVPLHFGEGATCARCQLRVARHPQLFNLARAKHAARKESAA